MRGCESGHINNDNIDLDPTPTVSRTCSTHFSKERLAMYETLLCSSWKLEKYYTTSVMIVPIMHSGSSL